ncbi:putative CRISPR-associated protein [Alkalinema pantanalense CENA528]|uniref:putative CRISPR-associated protein n=1 Tax=Alkalinema pantanalense TaxID=1620705 RepID=UPI003D6EAA4B
MFETSKPKIVISTIGTSLLTNRVDRNNPDEKTWQTELRDEANLSMKVTSIQVQGLIQRLKERAEQQLGKGIAAVRRASAELNGIYGLYDEDLSQAKQDMQWLIATDTAQGCVTAEIVEAYLRQQGLTQVEIYMPKELSTASTEHFSEGVDDLISWLQQTIEPLRDRYEVIFNLVGGFKSLQGYMNTIGMFYADEIAYIFEGQGSPLIRIPRLPISIDESMLEPHRMQLALANAGGISVAAAVGIPEIMLGTVGDRKVLSTWGLLLWNKVKQKLLSQNLLAFPRLKYATTFTTDYQNVLNPVERCQIQSLLAEVTSCLEASNGDTSALARFTYTRYKNSDAIDHFRVNDAMRISCRKVDSCLELRYYGTHEHVERSEGLR